jgi:hypothetical protein
MENKKTTELIDLLNQDFPDSAYEDDGEYTLIINELKTRSPFQEMLSDWYDESLPNLAKQVEYLQEQVKLLKRHKHDEKNGDVLVRI